MSNPDTAADYPSAEHTGRMADIEGLPEDHPARLLWEGKLAEGEHGDAARVDEYHNALKRHLGWLHKPMPEAVEGARLGMHAVVSHEVSDPTEAERQRELIDQAASCYERYRIAMREQHESDTQYAAKHFDRVEAGGPVRGYLAELAGRNAAAMNEAVAGDPVEQARAKERLAAMSVEFALLRQFDEEYFDRVRWVGHTQAIEQVSSELGAMVYHHANGRRDQLLETLDRIKAVFDEEGRA